ncbi:hypothetical protein [Hydrogenophaga sp.]|uniref:hypothetical protein n=1 Tax=Hydrogenophaga sp. TaxID=1904254 RepID=UPI002715D1A7|nr:hypothetical protein [Hydrogenophaga sp.]MDO9434045.1 hypothetical protein [Hydrogenophaga sp.]
MKSIESWLLLIFLLVGGLFQTAGIGTGRISSLMFVCAGLGLAVAVGAALISKRVMPDEHAVTGGWTAWKLISFGSQRHLNGRTRCFAVGAGGLICVSIAMFGFLAGLELMYSLGR